MKFAKVMVALILAIGLNMAARAATDRQETQELTDEFLQDRATQLLVMLDWILADEDIPESAKNDYCIFLAREMFEFWLKFRVENKQNQPEPSFVRRYEYVAARLWRFHSDCLQQVEDPLTIRGMYRNGLLIDGITIRKMVLEKRTLKPGKTTWMSSGASACIWIH